MAEAIKKYCESLENFGKEFAVLINKTYSTMNQAVITFVETDENIAKSYMVDKS